MAAYALSNFHESLRALLGDEGDAVDGFDFLPAQLDAALRTVVRTMRCLAIDPANSSQLLDAPPNGDTWYYVVAKAAQIMIGGKVDENVKTRALSTSVDPNSRKNALRFIDSELADLDERGNVCGTAQDVGHQGLFATAGDAITHIQICLPPYQTPPSCCSSSAP